MTNLTRRTALKATAASFAAAGFGQILPAVGAAENAEVSWATINPGSFTTLVMEYMTKRQLDRKHGVAFPKPHVYTSVNTYYNDFVVGNYELCMGAGIRLRPATRPAFRFSLSADSPPAI